MKKIYLSITLILFLMLSGCGLGHIEDKNGEDNYELSTYNENDFFNVNSSSMFGNITTQINNKYTQKVSKMSGCSKLLDLDDNSDYSIEFKVNKGNGLVGIICDEKTIFTINPNSSLSISVPSGKDYMVFILGESCGFEITIIKK